jgi:hypothetical protein
MFSKLLIVYLICVIWWSIEGLETIRLCDLLQIEQNEGADRMGISSKTFWNFSAKNAGMSGNQNAMKDVPQTVQSAIPAEFTELAVTEEENG